MAKSTEDRSKTPTIESKRPLLRLQKEALPGPCFDLKLGSVRNASLPCCDANVEGVPLPLPPPAALRLAVRAFLWIFRRSIFHLLKICSGGYATRRLSIQ